MRRVLIALLLTFSALSDTEIKLPADVYPVGLAAAADGTLWYASFPNEIGRVLPSGEIERVKISSPFYIASATVVLHPDGGVAVGDANGFIAKVDRMMNITRVDVRNGSYITRVTDMLSGADGNLWFVASPSGMLSYVGRLTPSGEITRFPLPSTASTIAPAPWGAFYVAGFGKIYHVRNDGYVTLAAACGNCSPGWLEMASDGTLWTAEGRLQPNGSFIVNYLGGRDAVRGPDGNIWIAPDTNALRAYAAAGALAREVPFREAQELPLSIASSGAMIWYGVRGAIRGFDVRTQVDLKLRAGDIVTVEHEQNCCFEGTHPVLAFHRRGEHPFLRRIERSPGNEYEGGGIFAVDEARILFEESSGSATILDGEGVPREILSGPPGTYAKGIVVDRNRRIHALREHPTTHEYRLLTYAPDGTLLNHVALPISGGAVEAIDLAADQCTLYYATYSYRTPGRVSRLDICTGALLSDLAGDLPDSGRDLRILPNGDILVVFGRRMVRFKPDGTIVEEYEAPKDNGLLSVALDLDPAFVWVGASELWRVNLATGRIVERVPVYGSPRRISIIGEPRAARVPIRRRGVRR